jgi:37-kD nucleoid-associated bacterial protein
LIFENLTIKRVALHEVFARADDRTLRQPTYADGLETLGTEAMTTFRLRVTDALSSKSVQMRIAKSGADSFLARADAMMDADDDAFLEGSQKMAASLAEAQLHRRIPGGMLIVFDGTVGAPAVPFVGVVKAETQEAFRHAQSQGKRVMEYLANIFLTPATRFYKIGIMLRDDSGAAKPDGWRAFVFDKNISPSDREAAAIYFYDAFLGCTLPDDAPYETSRFFDLTKAFVRESDLDPDKKRDVMDSLYVFLRDEQFPTFTASEFAEHYLPLETRDAYSGYLEAKAFTATAVVRDLSEMGTRLRRRRFKFGADVELSASPDALKQKVLIQSIDGDPADGETPVWTRITIRQAMTDVQ